MTKLRRRRGRGAGGQRGGRTGPHKQRLLPEGPAPLCPQHRPPSSQTTFISFAHVWPHFAFTLLALASRRLRPRQARAAPLPCHPAGGRAALPSPAAHRSPATLYTCRAALGLPRIFTKAVARSLTCPSWVTCTPPGGTRAGGRGKAGHRRGRAGSTVRACSHTRAAEAAVQGQGAGRKRGKEAGPGERAGRRQCAQYASPPWTKSNDRAPRAHLHAAAGDADGAAGLQAVEEELLHRVVVQGACRGVEHALVRGAQCIRAQKSRRGLARGPATARLLPRPLWDPPGRPWHPTKPYPAPGPTVNVHRPHAGPVDAALLQQLLSEQLALRGGGARGRRWCGAGAVQGRKAGPGTLAWPAGVLPARHTAHRSPMPPLMPPPPGTQA